MAFAALAALLLLRNRPEWLLAFSIATPVGAVLTAGSSIVLAPFQVACLVLAVVGFARSSSSRAHAPGRTALLVLLVYGTAITLIGPTLFAGIDVLPYSETRELQYRDPSPLGYSATNVSQVAYLALAVVMVFAVTRRRRATPAVLGAGLAVAMLLTLAAYSYRVNGTFWLPGFFDNDPRGTLIETDELGNLRNRGVFPEPASLATAAIAAVAYFAVRLRVPGSGRVKVFALAMIALAIFNMYTANATTAVVAAVATVGLAVAVAVGRFVFGGAKLSPGMALVGLAAAAVVTVLAPSIYEHLSAVISDKSTSLSYSTRTGGNAAAFDVFRETVGLGAGLGTTRTFALWANLLASVGAVGTAAFLTAVVQMSRAAWQHEDLRPVVAGVGAFLTAQMVSGAVIVEPVVWTGLAVMAARLWTAPVAEPVVSPTRAVRVR